MCTIGGVGWAWSWRRGWDSNPRGTCAPTRFPGVPDRPLQHLSGELGDDLLWRRGWDSNPRGTSPHLPIFEIGSFGHSDTSPPPSIRTIPTDTARPPPYRSQLKESQMTHARTVSELLSTHDPAGAAINAPGRDALTFDGLRAQIERTGETLNGFGLGREDPIAIVLPNGPEMATAFLGVASAATSAPLNPGYRAEEFDFYLSDLEARAVLVQRGDSSPVLDVAAKPRHPDHRADPLHRPTRGRVHARGRHLGRGRAARRRRSRRCGARPAHLRHHRAAQDRAPAAAQRVRLRRPHPRNALADP